MGSVPFFRIIGKAIAHLGRAAAKALFSQTGALRVPKATRNEKRGTVKRPLMVCCLFS